MARVLVTGGAGYIGSHACKQLARRGHEPVVFDNLSRGRRELVRWGPLEIGDVSDATALDRVFQRYRPDCVMHFAALAYVGESMSNPGPYYHVNVTGSLTLLDAMRRHGVNMLVFSSTCATYGIPDVVPLTESHPQRPITPYGASKLMVEHVLTDYSRAYGIASVALRYFNAAGADPDGEIGELHDPETHAIPLLLMAVDGRIPCFDVYGTDFPTPDGSAVRDYIHVCDLADAHVRALDYLRDGGRSVALNLGTERGTSVLQLLEVVEQVTGRAVPHRLLPRRPGDPAILVADAAMARKTLGWAPTVTDIADTVTTAYAWMRQRSPAMTEGAVKTTPCALHAGGVSR
ncbi:UDP-glucose 4-epimerase GalE [Azospirillum largimobile]